MNFRRTPFEHQVRALEFTAYRPFYALLAEQGTGKCFILNNDVARRYSAGALSGVLVLAPNGVHTNWVLREIPQDIPEGIDWRAAAYYSGANRKETAAVDHVLAPAVGTLRPPLRYLTLNWEALNTEEGFSLAQRFCELMANRGRGLMIVGDESQRIKNPKARRTKALFKLRPFSRNRAILSGTPTPQSPWDSYSQFSYLSPDILGTNNFVEFKAQYAQLVSDAHYAMRHIATRLRKQPWFETMEKRLREKGFYYKEIAKYREYLFGEQGLSDREADAHIVHLQTSGLDDAAVNWVLNEYLKTKLPAIVERDAVTGAPKWRNLHKLDALLAPHSFRVLKKDCLDLPPKVYKQRWFKMTPKQKAVYDKANEELRLALSSGFETAITKLVKATKLSQIASGYFIVPGATGSDTENNLERIMPREKNPKLAVLREALEDLIEAGQSVIIWARFRIEHEDIAWLLGDMGEAFVQYHGGVPQSQRTLAIEMFQSGSVKVFLGQQAAAGTGLTLTRANNSIYYTNTFSLEDRLQSEDRNHRIGTVGESVTYTDLMAEESRDPAIIDCLRNKEDVQQIIVGDARRALELVR